MGYHFAIGFTKPSGGQDGAPAGGTPDANAEAMAMAAAEGGPEQAAAGQDSFPVSAVDTGGSDSFESKAGPEPEPAPAKESVPEPAPESDAGPVTQEVPVQTVLDVPAVEDDDDGDVFGMDAGTVETSVAPPETDKPPVVHETVVSSRTGNIPAQTVGKSFAERPAPVRQDAEKKLSERPAPVQQDAEKKPPEVPGPVKPAVEKKPAEKKAMPAAARGVDSDKTSYVYVPRNIANIISGLIPQASNRNDAITTFLYIALNREPDVSDKIKELAEGYVGDGELDNLRAQVELLRGSVEGVSRKFESMDVTLAEIVTMLVWLVGDKRNASIDYSGPVDRTDFLFKEHAVIRSLVSAQTKEYSRYIADMRSRMRYKSAAAARDRDRSGK